MKKLVVILAFAFGTSPAIAQDTFEPKGMKFGVDWQTHRDGWGANFEFFTPQVASWGTGGELAQMHLFAGFGALAFPNVYLENGTFQETGIGKLAAGARIASTEVSDVLIPYANFAVTFMNADDKVYSSSTLWGGQLTIGADIPYTEPSLSLFGRVLGSFYVQTDFDFGHGRADKLAGGPDLIDGMSFRMGLRSNF